jgi:hypothetical protein
MQLSDDGFRGSDLLDAALPDDGWPIWGTGHLYFRNGVFKYMWNDGTSLQPDPAHVVNIFE